MEKNRGFEERTLSVPDLTKLLIVIAVYTIVLVFIT